MKNTYTTIASKATTVEISTIGDKIVACNEAIESLNEKLEVAIRERDENGAHNQDIIDTWTSERASLMEDVYVLRNMLTNIAEEYKNDEAVLAIIENAKRGIQHEERERVEKTTRVKLLSYGVPTIKPANLFGKQIMRAINAIKNKDEHGKLKVARKGEYYKEYISRINAEAAKALAFIENWLAENEPFPTIDVNSLEIRTLRQSTTSDVVGIIESGRQDKIAVIDHNLKELFSVMDADEKFPARFLDGKDLKGSQRIERIIRKLIERFDAEGFNVKFGERTVHFETFCYSNSGLKDGSGMLMNSKTYEQHKDAFNLMLDELPETNGAEQFKIRALFNTPSAIWQREWKDEHNEVHMERIHLRDLIMMDEVEICIPLNKSITVGEGKDVAVTVKTKDGDKTVTLPITINNNSIKIRKIAGWDGLMLVNRKDFQPCQARIAGSMKTLAVGVYGLLEQLIAAKPEYAEFAGKDIYVKDIDGNMHLWEEGCCLTTTTTWKAKKWFKGQSWAQYVANCEKLAEVYDGFDCLRIVSNADALDEMEKERHTSRQLLSQLINMTEDDAHLLLENNAKKVSNMRTVRGAVRHLAGLGKADDATTQLEYLFRVVPHMVRLSKVKTYILSKMYDKIAEFGACTMPMRETTLFMMQDPTGMMEILLLGADPSDPNLGLLKAGEISTPGMRDGKKSVVVRYPSNGLNAKVMVNRKIDMFKTCGNIIVLNIHDPWIVENDGDCDGDHAAAYENDWLVKMFERLEKVAEDLGLNVTVLFAHGDGAESSKATKEWLAKGRCEAVYNGMAFNYVGQCSNAALFAWTECSRAYNAGNYQRAFEYGMLANLFQVSAILTIDWCKTGVPAKGTQSRLIFDTAMDLLRQVGERENCHRYGSKPWAQLFRDHEAAECFVTKSKAEKRIDMNGNTIMQHKYAKPSNAAIDVVAKAVMTDAGIAVDETGVITKTKFEDTIDFDPIKELEIEDAHVVIDGKLVAAKSAQMGVIRSRLLHQINQNKFNPDCLEGAEDREIATAIKNGERVSVIKFARFCFRMLSELERGFAKESKNSMTTMSSADVHDLVYKATRSMLHSMIDDTPWSYKPSVIDPATGETTKQQLVLNDITDADRKWQIIVDTIMRDALEIGGANTIGASDDSMEAIARKKARYAMFALNVFAPDLLDRLEKKAGLHMTHANLDFITVEQVIDRRDAEPEDGFVYCADEEDDFLFA